MLKDKNVKGPKETENLQNHQMSKLQRKTSKKFRDNSYWNRLKQPARKVVSKARLWKVANKKQTREISSLCLRNYNKKKQSQNCVAVVFALNIFIF